MGIPIENYRLYSFHFAEDQVILAKDQNDIHYILRKIDESRDIVF